MKMIKIGSEYYHILHEFNVESATSILLQTETIDNHKKQYIVYKDGEIIYFKPQERSLLTEPLWDKIFWNLSETTEKLKVLENTRYRNQTIKEYRIRELTQVIQHMTNHVRNIKIDQIISEETNDGFV